VWVRDQAQSKKTRRWKIFNGDKARESKLRGEKRQNQRDDSSVGETTNVAEKKKKGFGNKKGEEKKKKKKTKKKKKNKKKGVEFRQNFRQARHLTRLKNGNAGGEKVTRKRDAGQRKKVRVVTTRKAGNCQRLGTRVTFQRVLRERRSRSGTRTISSI